MNKSIYILVVLFAVFTVSCGSGGGGSNAPEAAGVIDWDFISHINSFTWDSNTGYDYANKAVRDTAGRMIVAGTTGNGADFDVVLMRFNPDGSIDSSFGSSGLATFDSGRSDRGNDMAILPDGKILVAGSYDNGSDSDVLLLKFNSNGTLDTTFGSGGMITWDGGEGDDQGYDLEVQPDGKILVSGSSDNGTDSDALLIRFYTDGNPDVGFWQQRGTFLWDSGNGSDVAQDLFLHSDGSIVVAGYAYGTDLDTLVLKYNSEGGLDTGFGNDGAVIWDIGSGKVNYGRGVSVQADGKVLVTGECYDAAFDRDVFLVRFGTDGNVDNDFGSGGYVIWDSGNAYDEGRSVAVQPDGKILAGGYFYNGDNYDLFLLKYDTSGNPDPAFGTGGWLSWDSGEGDFGQKMDVHPDGTILIAGSHLEDSDYDLKVSEFKAGLVTWTLLRYDTGWDAAVQPDGRILVAGSSWNGGSDDALVVRYNANGILDTSFSYGGFATLNLSGHEDGRSIALQDDGKILITGRIYTAGGYDVFLVRLNADGSRDTEFGGDGWVTWNSGGEDYASAVAIQSDGKILVAGQSVQTPDGELIVLRYNTDGSRDKNFGSSGVARWSGVSSAGGNALDVISGDSFLVAGESYNGSDGDVLILKYDADGNLDSGFGSGGAFIFDSGDDEIAYAMALDPDGGILVAGYIDNSNDDVILLRITDEGDLDTAFGINGIASWDGGDRDEARGVAVDASGKILVSGYFSNGTDNGALLLRYLPDGSLDMEFGANGLFTWDNVGVFDNIYGMAMQADGKILMTGTCQYLSEYGPGVQAALLRVE